MGWSKDPGPTNSAGRLPAIIFRRIMRELSIFVDESGDFGPYSKHSPYYIISMILHDQSVDISEQIKKLDNELSEMGYRNHVVHTEPLIRREEDYSNLYPNERRTIFTKLFYFVSKCDIKYKSFIFNKKDYQDIFKLEAKMARDISFFIRENLKYFLDFDKVILYYDNGQHELSRILNTVLATELADYDVRKVLPMEYKLFQAADLICTLELLKIKTEKNELSKSEQLIFHSKRELKKDFFKGLAKKEF